MIVILELWYYDFMVKVKKKRHFFEKREFTTHRFITGCTSVRSGFNSKKGWNVEMNWNDILDVKYTLPNSQRRAPDRVEIWY